LPDHFHDRSGCGLWLINLDIITTFVGKQLLTVGGEVDEVRQCGMRGLKAQRHFMHLPSFITMMWLAHSHSLFTLAQRANVLRQELSTMPQARIRLLLIDDNAIFLRSLLRLVATDAGLTVVASVTTPDEGLALAKELQPDTILVDLRMPQVSGFTLISLIRSQLPNICVIAMTLDDEERMKTAALKRGAHAFILKDNMFQELIPTIRKLYESGSGDHPTTDNTKEQT
jgi:CheY-like chemotaxis protein